MDDEKDPVEALTECDERMAELRRRLKENISTSARILNQDPENSLSPMQSPTGSPLSLQADGMDGYRLKASAIGTTAEDLHKVSGHYYMPSHLMLPNHHRGLTSTPH